MAINYNQHITIDGRRGPNSARLERITGTRGRRWDANNYEFAVQRTLNEIAGTDCGKILFNNLDHTITIIPYRKIHQAGANAGMHRPWNDHPTIARANLRNMVEDGEWVRDRRNGRIYRITGAHGNVGGLRGNGQGIDTMIRFTPGMFDINSDLFVTRRNSAFNPTPTRVLFHEMVHAQRQATGHFSFLRLPRSLRDWDNIEEFVAILVTNIFCSETGRPLRQHHGGPFQLLQNPGTFFDNPDHRRLIRYFCNKQPTLTRQLSRVSTGFNPIAQHYNSLITGEVNALANR